MVERHGRWMELPAAVRAWSRLEFAHPILQPGDTVALLDHAQLASPAVILRVVGLPAPLAPALMTGPATVKFLERLTDFAQRATPQLGIVQRARHLQSIEQVYSLQGFGQPRQFLSRPGVGRAARAILLAGERPACGAGLCRGVAQPGSAQRSGRWGRQFKSGRPDHSFQLRESHPPLGRCPGQGGYSRLATRRRGHLTTLRAHRIALCG